MTLRETTTRERLQARRERIKAGLPPPAPVTVTDSFLNGMDRLKPIVCIGCNVVFTPKMKTQRSCGDPYCVRTHNSRRKKQTYYQAKEALR